MRIIYNFLFFFFALFYLPFFFLKGKHKQGFSQRLGIVPQEVKERLKGKKVLWVHAVSVGEVVQALRLADVLRPKLAGTVFVLTTTTATGREVAGRLKKPEDVLLCFPIDFRFCVRSFVRSVRPEALVILETEIWPNLIWELSKNHIPVFIVNGRLSDRAFERYRFFTFFFKPLLNLFQMIAVQDEQMRSRFLRLGAAFERMVVTGSMKYDWQPPPVRKEIAKKEVFLCVAGSTHEGEEEMLFKIYKNLKKKFPDFRLAIAPRHPSRMASIENQAAHQEVALGKASSAPKEDSVWVIHEMGVLADWYRAADAVFVGGSLVPVGGHNLVEPAFFEKPVLFGPYTHNFREMAGEFKRQSAGIEVQNKEDLEKTIETLITDPQKRQTLGHAAKKLVLAHAGATQKNAEVIAQALVK